MADFHGLTTANTARSAPVLVVGSSGLDTIAHAAAPLLHGSSAPGLIRRAFGGVARNIAENLARLEVPTILVTAVADDGPGRDLLAHAGGLGIDVAHSVVIPGGDTPTGEYVAIFDERGAVRVAVDQMAAIAAITPKVVRELKFLFRQAAFVVLDANLAPETLGAAIKLARAAGVPVCADPAAVLLAPRLIPHLAELNLLVANGAEAAALCGAAPPHDHSDRAVHIAKELVARGVETAVVTLGAAGVGYAMAEVSGHIPALNVEVVEATGAGDAFTAALLFALLNEVPVDEAVRLGVSAAALTLRSRETVVPELNEELLYEQLV